jgi:hypothetical protein
MATWAVGVKIEGSDSGKAWVFEAGEDLEIGAEVAVITGGFSGYTGTVVSLGRDGYTGPLAKVERFTR